MDSDRWDRVSAVFGEAVEVAVEERQQFLEQACGDDQELLQEVESLLAAHSSAQGEFLEQLSPAAAGHLDDTGAKPPERIGSWRVVGEIGRGGMGVVYEARRDDGQFEQTAAVKLIKRGMDSEQILERFLRERQILARMEHPGIARLLDGGVTSQGRPWFALERVEGAPLTEYCDQQGLDVKARLRLFGEVCSAVEYAHRNLVVHRDLKPSNVLVDDDRRVKLLDFGIAKILRNSDESAGTRTAAEGRLVSPGYGAPELVLGDPITTATDVYSLGVILYEMLSGARPYELQPGPIANQIMRQAGSPPPKLSTVAAKASRRRGLDSDLDTIAAKAVQFEPQRRYASAEALREDVERYLRSEPVRACPDSLAYRAKKFFQRHRTSVVAAILVILSLVLGLGAALWQADVAARERDTARQESEQAQQARDFIVDLFRDSDPREPGGPELTARQILDRGLERVRSRGADRPDLRVELLNTVGEVSTLLGDYAGARALYKESLEIDSGERVQDQLRLAAALNGYGQASGYLGEDEVAEEHQRRALDIYLELSGLDDLETAQAFNDLGVALARQRKLPEAVESYRKSVDIYERVAGPDHPETLSTLGNLSLSVRLMGDFLEAERLLELVIERMRRSHGEGHSDMGYYLGELAAAKVRLGRLQEAEPMSRRSFELTREFWGESHPTTSVRRNNFAMVAHKLGNDLEAEELMRQTLAHEIDQYGSEHSYVAMDHDNLARVLVELGRVDEALRQIEIAERIHTARSSPRLLASHRLRHAQARLAAGELEAARDLIDAALAFERQRDPQNPEKLTEAVVISAYVRSALGLVEEAESLFREALSLIETWPSADHPESAWAHFGLGELYLIEGRIEEARAALERASEIWSQALPEGHWRRAEAQVALGECLVRQGRGERGQQLLDEGITQLRSGRGEEHWRTLAALRRRDAL